MDLATSIIPKSDQINADDLMAGPRTVTITDVTKGTAEQPVNVVTEEFGTGRPYKPSKSMRRVLVVAWGVDSSNYVGRQLTLFRNPKIRFGKDEVGGIQISHMSHLPGPLTVALTVTRGKRAPFIVQPLGEVIVPVDESGRDWLTEAEALTTWVELNRLVGVAIKSHADEETVAAIRLRRDEQPKPETSAA